MTVSDAERSRAAAPESLRGTAFRHEMDEAPVLWRVLRWYLLQFGLLHPHPTPARQQHAEGDRSPRRVQGWRLTTRPHLHGARTAATARLGPADMDTSGGLRTASEGPTKTCAGPPGDVNGIQSVPAAAPSQGSEEELAELQAQVLSWGCASTLAGACCALMAFALLIGLATHAYGLIPGKSSEATSSAASGAGLPGPHTSPSPR
jgi:hypothetical protein